MEYGFMKNSLIKSLMVVAAALSLIGCVGGSNAKGNGTGQNGELPSSVTDAINAPKSTLTQDLKDSITYM